MHRLEIFITQIIVVAQDSPPWRIEGGITISHFQQQVKSEIGGPKGDELVNNFEFGLITTGTYDINEYFAVGLFTRFDTGERNMAIFDGFDEHGRAMVKNKVGGSYTEIWIGPLIAEASQRISTSTYVFAEIRRPLDAKD